MKGLEYATSPWVVGLVAVAMALPLGMQIRRRHEIRRRAALEQLASEQALHETYAQLNTAFGEIQRHRRRLPDAPDPSWLVTEAVALGEMEGLQLTSIAQEQPREFPQYTRVAIALEFEAMYHQLGAFLDRVERSQRFMRVDRLEVIPPPAAAAGGGGSARSAWPSGQAAGGGMKPPTAGIADDHPTAAIHLTLSTVYLPPLVRRDMDAR
jgi:hypothetical protein